MEQYIYPLSAGGGTDVVANPTLAGTEDALTGLQVGDTKYKVEAGGGALYRHEIFLTDYAGGSLPTSGTLLFGFITVLSTSAIPFTTASSFADYLSDNGFIKVDNTNVKFHVYSGNIYIKSGSTTAIYPCGGIAKDDYQFYITINGTYYLQSLPISSFSIQDNVFQIM